MCFTNCCLHGRIKSDLQYWRKKQKKVWFTKFQKKENTKTGFIDKTERNWGQCTGWTHTHTNTYTHTHTHTHKRKKPFIRVYQSPVMFLDAFLHLWGCNIQLTVDSVQFPLKMKLHTFTKTNLSVLNSHSHLHTRGRPQITEVMTAAVTVCVCVCVCVWPRSDSMPTHSDACRHF